MPRRSLELLEVDIPDPGHVLPVSDAVVERNQERVRRAELDRGPQDFVESGWVLCQQQDRGTIVDDGPFHPAEGGREVAQGGGALRQRYPQGFGRRQRHDDVVGVVQARQWNLDIGLVLTIGDPQAHALHAVDRDRGRPDVGRRPGKVAPGAAIAADVPEIDAVEDEGAAAPRTELGVGAMAQF